MKQKLHVTIILWVVLVTLSFSWNFMQSREERSLLAFETARAFFQQVVLTRRWNASHGGVYAPVTDTTPPNPHLEVPRREIEVSDDLTLTKINPAYMTRQLSEIASDTKGIRFHITSLNPIRPENAPEEWEAAALKSFETGNKESGFFFEEDGWLRFRYMAPLNTEKVCLRCHAKQGYKEGEVRGGISVTLPRVAEIPILALVGGHLAIAVAGLAFIIVMGRLLQSSHEKLSQQAVMDALTRIPNRRFFSEQVVEEFRRGRREHRPLSLIICDIDNFKKYNDHFGHQGGDACLQKVAETIAAGMRRGGDFCARYGGEEFVVLLPDTTLEGAALMAMALRSSVEGLRQPHPGNPAGVVTISMGVAMDDGNHSNYETLIRQADEALYLAKANGRNRVELFDPARDDTSPEA
jgi:diguanylate cyclase (GGDEF)-like protein